MINADLSNVFGYADGVAGTLNAVEDPRFQGDFTDTLISKLKTSFMADAIAANRSGWAGISHAFEWGGQDGRGVATGRPSSIPLFKLTAVGGNDKKVLTYTFLPSTQPVPLPDPAEYGFKASKLAMLRRHKFIMKAWVMESGASVTIAPKRAKALFIPSRERRYGYLMSRNPVTIQPGGHGTTGGFRNFWLQWFESRAQIIVNEETASAEEIIAATGQKVIRYAAGTKINGVSVGGQFARGRSVSIGYTNRTSQFTAMAHNELGRYYSSFIGDDE